MLGLILGFLIILAIVVLWVVRGRRTERARGERDAQLADPGPAPDASRRDP